VTLCSWLIVVASAVLLAAIFILHSRPVPVRRAHRTMPIERPATLDAALSPCSESRIALACDRWASAGWPGCSVTWGWGVPVVAYDGSHAGAVASDGTIGIAPHRCHVDDAALEHELGHALHDLAHAGGVGSVMHSEQPGLRFPRGPHAQPE